MTLRDRLDRVLSGYQWLAAAAVIAVGLAVIDTLPVGGAQDDGWYLILAKSLATGQGYRWINLPNAPAATHFPPGYPAVLALLWWFAPKFPENVVWFKALNACFLAATAAGVAVFSRRRLAFDRGAAAGIAIVACIGIPTLVLSTMLMSEPFFMALLLPVLLLAERIVDGERRVPRIVAAAVLAGLTTLVRTHGIALIAAIALMLLLQRRVRDAAMAAAAALVVIMPWQLWVRANDGVVPVSMRGTYDSYGGWLAEGVRADGLSLIGRTIARTSGEIAGMFATLGAVSWPPVVKAFVLVTLAGIFAIGARRFWRAAPTTLLFVALYITIVVLWPFNPARFVWGIWPLVVLLVAAGVREAWRWTPSVRAARAARYALVAGVLVLTVGYLRYTARGYRGRWWSSIARQQTENATPLVVWAATRTRPDEVIASSIEPMVYLYSGRRTVSVTSFTYRYYFRPASVSENEAVLRDILSAYRVDAVAVVANDSLGVAAQAMAARTPPELVLRDTLANGLVFTPARP